MEFRIIQQYTALLFVFLVTLSALIAQAPFQNPIILNQKNGLPNNVIYDIEQDQEGFIWIATAKGLCRYDGSQMKIYDFVTNDTSNLYTRTVRHILPDKRTENLWLSTSLGLHVYNPILDTFKSYVVVSGDSSQLANNAVSYTYQDRQGQIWVSTFTDGLALYRPETDDFEQIFPSKFFNLESESEGAYYNQVNAFIQDYREDHIYWLVNKKGLTRWDRIKGEMKVMAIAPDAEIDMERLASTKIMYQHGDGTIFMGMWTFGFVTWHPNERQWRLYNHAIDEEEERINIRTIYTIVPKNDSTIYLTNGWNQLFLYNLNQQKIVKVWKANRRAKEQYSLQLIDKDGNHWAAYNRGVCIYNPLAQHMALYPLPFEGDDPELLYRPDGIQYDSKTGYILAGYSYAKGLYGLDLDNGKFHLMLRPQDRPLIKYFHGIFERPDQQIWILNATDLYVYLPQSRSLKKVRSTSDWNGASFIRGYQDSRGDIWLGTYDHGIFRFDNKNKKWRNYKEEIETPTEDRHSIWLWGFMEDQQGKIWFRTGTGYSVFNPQEDRFLNFPYKKGAKNNFQSILEFCLDTTNVFWVSGGRNGLGLMDADFPENGIFKQIGADEGMLLNGPHDMVCDKNNDIWLVDYEKLGRFKSQEQKFEYFDTYYGLPAYDDELDMAPLDGCNLTTIPDGRVVLQYRRGLAVFHPDSLKRNDILPIPYLVSFQVNNQHYPLDSAAALNKQVFLKAKENNFSFEFSAINFSVPHLTQFRYRLQGEQEENWIDVGERRYAAFTNVPGGDYTFQVMAANSDGLWNEMPFELSIHLATPWYQTSLFQIALLFFIGGIIFAIYKWRVNQIREQQIQKAAFERKLANVEMNALRAQMNPHFIFNCLNSIDSFIIRNETRKASEYLNDFARLIRLILQNSRSNLINLKDELEALNLYLQMEQLRFRQKFNYEINVDPDLNQPATVIPPMLIQPYVENAVWHGLLHRRNGVGGLVVIEIKEENDCLIISIVDNGIGRKKAAEIKAKKRTQSRKSMGIQITGDRIAMINHLYNTKASANTIDLEDDHGKALGTKVLIRIPV